MVDGLFCQLVLRSTNRNKDGGPGVGKTGVVLDLCNKVLRKVNRTSSEFVDDQTS